MLDLNSFHHLPQLDPLLDEITSATGGLVIVAGFDARPHLERVTMASGRGLLYGIVARHALAAHPHTRTAVLTEEKHAQLRLPTRSRAQIRILSPRSDETYGDLLKRVTASGYSQVFAERFSQECYDAALDAALRDRLIVTQMDTPLAGRWVAREVQEALDERARIRGLRAVIAVRRIETLCQDCKTQDGASWRAIGCARCSGTGRRGQVSVFDVWRAHDGAEPTETPSVLSFLEYAQELAREGLLAQTDVNEMEAVQFYRMAHLVSAGERHTVRATQSLRSQVTELQVAARTHEQQYLASFALQQVGHKLLELDTMQELAAYVCRRAHDLCGADRAVLYLLHHDQTAEIVALNGWDAKWLHTRVGYQELFRASGVGEGYSPFEGYPPGIPTRAADVEGAFVRAGMRIPLIAQREVVGAMIFHSTVRKDFDAREAALLHALANASAAAIQRAELLDSLRDKIEQLETAQKQIAQKERLERELELARTVQQNMLPHQFPLVAGIRFYARNEPARQVGGDFYDVFMLEGDRVGLVIADVSDKGMPAALFMALTRSLVRAEARNEPSPEQVLQRVHQLLLEVAEPTQFVTLFYGVLDTGSRVMTFVRAGHDYPLVLRQKEVITLRGVGTMLGLLSRDEIILNEQMLQLERGDRLVLYTDGITDAMNEDEEQFGRARLQEVASAYLDAPLEHMGDAILDAVAAHQGQAAPFDDVTLLVVEIS